MLTDIMNQKGCGQGVTQGNKASTALIICIACTGGTVQLVSIGSRETATMSGSDAKESYTGECLTYTSLMLKASRLCTHCSQQDNTVYR